MGGGGWTFFMAGWVRIGGVKIYFGWAGVDEQFLWVSGDGWGWMEVYLGWVGLSGRSHSFWYKTC